MFQKISYIVAMFITVSSFQLSIQAAEKQPLSEKERIQQNKPLSETYQELINLSTDNDSNIRIIEEYSKGEIYPRSKAKQMQNDINNTLFTFSRHKPVRARPVKDVLISTLEEKLDHYLTAKEPPIFAELFMENLPFILATAHYFGDGVLSQFDRTKYTKTMFTPVQCYWEELVENEVLRDAKYMDGWGVPFYRLLGIILDIVDEKIRSSTPTTLMFMRNYNNLKETLEKTLEFKVVKNLAIK